MMDDPLIGLTIYDTTSESLDWKAKAVNEGRVVPNRGRFPLKRNPRNDGSEDCFPCLPSIPDEQERAKSTKGSLESSETVAVKEELEGSHVSSEVDVSEQRSSSQSKNFWLMRLFQSSLFDMSIAIGYLFNSKDQSVQSYLGSRLFVSYNTYESPQCRVCSIRNTRTKM